MIRVAINGYGRIGRNILRSFYEAKELSQRIRIVAVNDLGDIGTLAHLTQYDTVHGRFHLPVRHEGSDLIVGEDRIRVISERDPAELPWKALEVDVVLECTGRFTTRDKAQAHLRAGARKVLVSAPGKEMDATIVFGVNDDQLTGDERIVSNASCTTNCLAPVVKTLHDVVGVESGFMTTIHSYTNDQHLIDVYHEDIYRARAAAISMIPTKTGAAAAIGLVVPELAGRLDGMAVRVPTINVSLVDLTFIAGRETSADEINRAIADAVKGPMGRVMAYSTAPLVSTDFNHTAYSSHFDANHTRAEGRLVKVLAWYDNEWAFSNRMLDTCLAMMARA